MVCSISIFSMHDLYLYSQLMSVCYSAFILQICLIICCCIYFATISGSCRSGIYFFQYLFCACSLLMFLRILEHVVCGF